MIRIYVTQDHDLDGGWNLYVTGHEHVASKKIPALICAGICAVWRTAIFGFEWYAKQHPDKVQLVVINHDKAKVPQAAYFGGPDAKPLANRPQKRKRRRLS
jgi:uncharacterized protein YsxB (DUF464 family)